MCWGLRGERVTFIVVHSLFAVPLLILLFLCFVLFFLSQRLSSSRREAEVFFRAGCSSLSSPMAALDRVEQKLTHELVEDFCQHMQHAALLKVENIPPDHCGQVFIVSIDNTRVVRVITLIF